MAERDLNSAKYAIAFAAGVCIVCSVFVSASAVVLRPRQEANKILDRQTKVLQVAGLLAVGESISADEVKQRFEANIRGRTVNLASGAYADDVDPATFDQRKATKDPALSKVAEANMAKVLRVPEHAVVYHVLDGDKVKKVVLPIEGKGLWSTLYGFLALGPDGNTIEGITFYEHGETPGLGGEVDNPKWKAAWPGRKAYGPDGAPKVKVIKGVAGPPDEKPYEVDGLSGATITANGVSHLLAFWLGEQGFKPYLKTFRQGRTGEESR